jgi:hypothetical protein
VTGTATPPLGAALLRRRWALCALVAAVFAVTTGSGTFDLPEFARAGQDILSGHWARVYAEDSNQAGPLQLVLSRFLSLGATRTPTVVVRLAVDLAVLAAARGLTVRCRTGAVATSTIAVVVTLWLGPYGFWTGHPTEALIPMLWVGAGLDARAGRWLRGGLLIGIATAIAPWAVLAAPTLLIGRPTVVARALAVTAAVTAAVYGPFVLTGHFALGDHVWPVGRLSLVHLLDPSLTTFPWAGRLLQGAAVAGGCAVIALALRARPEGVVLAPLMAAVLRRLTDPLSFDYYWVPVATAAVIALAVVGTTHRRALPLAAVAYLSWLAMALSGSVPLLPICVAAALTAGLCGAVLSMRWRQRRSRPPADTTDTVTVPSSTGSTTCAAPSPATVATPASSTSSAVSSSTATPDGTRPLLTAAHSRPSVPHWAACTSTVNGTSPRPSTTVTSSRSSPASGGQTTRPAER